MKKIKSTTSKQIKDGVSIVSHVNFLVLADNTSCKSYDS